MIQIIETNLMLDKKLNNFQSRVIEVESWDYVIKQFTSNDIINPKSYNTEELRDEIVEYSRIYNMHSLENKVLKKSLN